MKFYLSAFSKEPFKHTTLSESPQWSGVYRIANTFNGKSYVGSAVRVRYRWYEHLRHLEQRKHHSIALQRAWIKYGKDGFTFSVLEFCEKVELVTKEQFWIDQLKPEYNICETAGSSLGRRHSAATRKQMSLFRKGKSFHSAFQIRRIKEVHTGKKVSVRTRKKRARAVLQIDAVTRTVIARYYSCADAIRKTRINNIGSVLSGAQVVAGGFLWHYEKESEADRQKRLQKREKSIQGRIEGLRKAHESNQTPVDRKDLKTGAIAHYISIKEAALDSLNQRGIGHERLTAWKRSISAVVQGRQKTAYGFLWIRRVV